MMLLALTLAAGAQDAPATPCELRGVPAIDVIALRVAMLDQIANGTPRTASADATLTVIEGKAVACARTTEAAAGKRAATLAVTRFAADTVAEKLAADGVDMAKVDGSIAAAGPAVLDAFVEKRFDAPGVSALGDSVIAIAGQDASPETRKLLGAYTVNKARLVRSVRVGPGR